MADSSEAHWI